MLDRSLKRNFDFPPLGHRLAYIHGGCSAGEEVNRLTALRRLAVVAALLFLAQPFLPAATAHVVAPPAPDVLPVEGPGAGGVLPPGAASPARNVLSASAGGTFGAAARPEGYVATLAGAAGPGAEAAASAVGHRLDLDANGVEDVLDLLLAGSAPQDPVKAIVMLRDADAAASAAAALRLQGFADARAFHLVPAVALTLPAASVPSLSSLPGAVRVYHDAVVRATLDSSTPVMRAAEARATFGVDGSGVGIAVIDTGVDAAHASLDDHDDDPATSDPKVVGWHDSVNGQPSPYDDHGHGTHVAGTAAGTAAGTPYVGVAPGANVIGVKVLTGGGWGQESWIIDGVEWSVDNKDALGIDVISMSLGASINGDGTSPMEQAVTAAMHAGVVAVVAAGNSGPGPNTVGVPASAFDIVTVGALNDDKTVASFSSRGPTADGRLKPEVTAPGVSVTAAAANTGTGYATMSGTSMATPHVSGLVALLLERSGGSLAAERVREILMDTAEDLGEPGLDNAYGAGLADAVAAVAVAEPQEHDLSVRTISAPRHLRPGSSSGVNVTVKNLGFANETDVQVRLLQDGVEVANQTLAALPAGATVTLTLPWTAPAAEGVVNLTGQAAPVANETVLGNNARTTPVRVVEFAGTIRVAVLDSPGVDYASYFGWPSLEQRWYEFGDHVVDVDLVSVSRRTVDLAVLRASGADVLAIPDACCGFPEWTMTEAEMEAIAMYVEEGHGILGSLGTLSSAMPAHAGMEALFGLSGAGGAYRCASFGNVTFAAGSPFAEGIGASYTPGMRCATQGLTPTTAAVEATGGNGSAAAVYSHQGGAAGHGAAAYVTWGPEITGFGATQQDLQLVYNAFRWLSDLPGRPAVDLAVSSVRAPPLAFAGEPVEVSALVRNLGNATSPGTNLTLTLDGGLAAAWTVPPLAPLGELRLNHTFVPGAPGNVSVAFGLEPVPGDALPANDARARTLRVVDEAVLLVQDNDPWSHPSNQQALDALGRAYRQATVSELANLSLDAYWKIVVAGDQTTGFYNALAAEEPRLLAYAEAGGILELHAADLGWQNGQWTMLPGGFRHASACIDELRLLAPDHPVFRTPSNVTEGSLQGWSCSTHGYLTAQPNATSVLVSTRAGAPAVVESFVGQGTIVLSLQTLEFAHRLGRPHLTNLLAYAPEREAAGVAVGLLDGPTRVSPGGSAVYEGVVINTGTADLAGANATLLVDGVPVAFGATGPLAASGVARLSFETGPLAEGVRQVELRVASPPGETRLDDNARALGVTVSAPGAIAVLDLGTPEMAGVLARAGVARCGEGPAPCYDLLSPADFRADDLSQRQAIAVGWTDGATHDALQALVDRASAIEAFVASGGGLVAYAEYRPPSFSWVPGGANVSVTDSHGDDVDLTAAGAAHPALANQTSASLSGWGSSYHGPFASWPGYLEVLARANGTGAALTLAGSYGDGCVLLTAQDPDWHGHYSGVEAAVRMARTTVTWALGCAEGADLPDGRALDVALSHPSPSPGQTVTVSAIVDNAGEAAATFLVRLTVDGAHLHARNVTLAPGGWANVTADWTATAGTHTLAAVVDEADAVAESDETNNAASREVTVGSPGLPDLRIRLLNATPSVPREGDRVNLTVTVENAGNGTAPESSLLLSLDGDVLMERRVALPPGARATYSVSWNATAGNHSLHANADAFGEVGESDEGNNQRGQTLTVLPPAQADLVVTDLVVSPERPVEGERASIKMSFRNDGDAAATDFLVRILVDGAVVNQTRFGMGPGASATFSASWNATVGNHTVAAQVDALGDVAERNEANNELSRALAVSPKPRADLVVTLLRVVPDRPVPGQPTVLEAHVRNVGSATARGFTAAFLVDGATVGTDGGPFTFLPPGTVASFRVPWTAVEGEHEVRAVADVANAVDESDETNNQAAIRVDVVRVPLPDLTLRMGNVTKPTIRTDHADAGPNPVGIQRIEVVACNEGEGAMSGGSVLVMAEARGPRSTSSSEPIGSREVGPLAPGACRTLVVEWDPVGAIGDVTLHAFGGVYGYEEDTGDNHAEGHTFVVVGGLGGVILPLA